MFFLGVYKSEKNPTELESPSNFTDHRVSFTELMVNEIYCGYGQIEMKLSSSKFLGLLENVSYSDRELVIQFNYSVLHNSSNPRGLRKWWLSEKVC